MTNIMQMLKQAQEVQGKMAQMQENLEQVEVSGQAGGGLVQIIMNGKSNVRKIKIDAKLVDPNDVETLEDTILVALRDAKNQVDALVAGETEKAMGGMKLPAGFKLPF